MTESKHQRTPLTEDELRRTNPYASTHNKLSVLWKQRTGTLPPQAKAAGIYLRDGKEAGPYPVCLPREYASYNLLPEVRDGALDLFKDLDIPWHDSVDGGPSNHLRDSQVQCANALFAMVDEPERIKLAFGDSVDIAEVLPIEHGRYLTFEYIGPTDYFDEGRGKPRRRGTRCTSVDAAFVYRTSASITELALVEWKFTESYLRLRKANPGYDQTRTDRYRPDVLDPHGPVLCKALDFEWLLDEPFYQLMRQQLLAHPLEKDHVLGAEIVRVLHVLAPENSGYQDSLVRAEHRAVGGGVNEVWAKLLRTPDRFVHLDPVVFLDPAVTSDEYVDRYSPTGVGHA